MPLTIDLASLAYQFADSLFGHHVTEDTLRRAIAHMMSQLPQTAGIEQCSLFLLEERGIYREIVFVDAGQMYLDTNYYAEQQLPDEWQNAKQPVRIVTAQSTQIWFPFHDGELIGFMVWTGGYAMQELPVRDLTRVQSITTLAIRHFVEMQSTTHRLRMLQAAADLLHQISGTKSTETILYDLVTAGVNVLGFDRATLFIYDKDGARIERVMTYVLGCPSPRDIQPLPSPPTESTEGFLMPEIPALWVPLMMDERRLAGLFLDNLYSHERIPDGTLTTVTGICAQVSLLLQRMQLIEALNLTATLDDLTGLYRVNAFYQEGNQVLADMAARAQSTGLIVVDLDRFKEVNDTYGHPMGDSVLIQTSAIIKNLLPPGALAGRIGGDEFVILLPRFDASDSKRFAKYLLDQYVHTHFNFLFPTTEGLTLSIGVAVAPEDGHTINELIQVADKALYRSKRNGRAQVSTSADSA